MKATTPDRDGGGHPIFVQVSHPTLSTHRRFTNRVGHILYSQRREDLTALCYLICFSNEVEWLQPHELDRLDSDRGYNCSDDTNHGSLIQ